MQTEKPNISSSWQDRDVLKAINDALSPLSEFTDVMSGEKYVTISAILPVMNLLKTAVLGRKPMITQ